MYHGKYEARKQPAPQKKKRNNRSIVLLVSVALLVTALVGGTIAYLVANTSKVENTFQPSHVACAVDETFKNNGTEKTNVRIENTGDTDAYIRATVIVTWQDANGNVYGQTPVKDTDYTLVFSSETGWTLGTDGYYYYKDSVAPGNSTGLLIDSCKVNAAAPAEGYTLHVEILAQAIQSKGGAVEVDGSGVWTQINNPAAVSTTSE